jgi:hypothetical protein
MVGYGRLIYLQTSWISSGFTCVDTTFSLVSAVMPTDWDFSITLEVFHMHTK